MKTKLILGSIVLILSTSQASWQDMAKDVLGNMSEEKNTTNTQKSTETLNETTVSKGLKEALKIGVDYAVKTLGAKDGYLNNSEVKIPLPQNIQSAATLAKQAGGEKIVNDLVVSMNNAATNAAPKTAAIFLNAIDKMGIEDAKQILNGEDNAATNYFKTNTLDELKKTISPIIKESMKTNQVATYYDTFNTFYKNNAKSYVENSSVMDYAKSFGVDSYLPSSSDETLDEYITNKALDGLFKLIEEKEQAIRKNPVEQTTNLLKQIFG